MANDDSAFVGSIPELYDTHLVPLIFESYAADLADRVSALRPRSVLEIAAGSGVVTRALARRLSAEARYVVTDLNQPMLDYAQSRQHDDARLTWQVADSMELPFESESFDAIVCQFSVMFFPDKVAAFREARRVLGADGNLLFNVWDTIEENEFSNVVTDAVASVFPEDPPQFLARTPHGYHDQALIEAQLSEAGFKQVACTTLTKASVAPSPRDVAVAYCQGTPLRNEIEARDATRLAEITDIAEQAIAQRFGSGEVAGKTQGIVVSATR